MGPTFFVWTVLASLIFVSVSAFNGRNAEPAKTFIVDLDDPPMQRWQKVVLSAAVDASYYKQGIDKLLKAALSSEALVELVEVIAKDIEKFIPQPFADEIRGISQATGIPLGDVVIANIIYDVSAFGSSGNKACTSIVTADKSGKIYHGRNLDYEDPEFLKNLTIQVDFHQNGKSLFMATTYLGYVGVITGSRHGAFSISGDERDSGEWWQNLIAVAEKSDITFFHERMILEKCTNFKEALTEAMSTPTIAPVYYIIGGIKPKEGAIVVRNAHTLANVTMLGMDQTHPWYLVETNYDPWKAPPASDDRRDAAIHAMNRVGQDEMDAEMLYKVLSVPLVFNKDTTYTTVMSAADSSVYRTMIRWDGPED
uniref:N-acylethanolamine-hydrolyzing acid amidase n=1 Tax=Phallusia mammillata TaxID=59560 RepID=A0A6F9DL60_9ASCI|nr:N-acylethanolamine-hydrolyzing acid amidase-like [Phallusia mammillata]